MIKIPGYQVVTKIHESSRSVIYSANRIADNKKVVIKTLNAEYPGLKEVAKLRREFEILQKLKGPRIIKAFSIEKYKNSPALILENFGGVALSEQSQKLNHNIEAFLITAIQIASALGEIHKSKIIHKDIKPSNILINPLTGEVKIIDFGLSSMLEKENQLSANPTLLEGTLEYISPEQTGRMNRAIDVRTDFYSLGITFYELLCGRLPFVSNDPVEIVHAHIAQQPIVPHNCNPQVPKRCRL
jgi:serine/threonine protein kinase